MGRNHSKDRKMYVYFICQSEELLWVAGPCRDLWKDSYSKYNRGSWNTNFNRSVLLADMCIYDIIIIIVVVVIGIEFTGYGGFAVVKHKCCC